MAGKICVYIRDRDHPADLYDSTTHPYKIDIREIGSLGYLCWKGTTYHAVPLTYAGERNRIAGEFEVPAGTYVVIGYAPCNNVVTHWAWVQVNDGETVSVNLLVSTFARCMQAIVLGAQFGTVKIDGKYTLVKEMAPAEVKAFGEAAKALLAKIPKEEAKEMWSAEEIKKLLSD